MEWSDPLLIALEVGLGLAVFFCIVCVACLLICSKDVEMRLEEQQRRRGNVDLRSMILALRPAESVPTAPPLTALEEAANPQQPPSPPPPYEEVTQTPRKEDKSWLEKK